MIYYIVTIFANDFALICLLYAIYIEMSATFWLMYPEYIFFLQSFYLQKIICVFML